MRLTFALLVLLAMPFAVRGEDSPDAGVTAPEVAAALKHAGYPADVIADRGGQPSIRSSTGKVLFNVHFFQCDGQLRCASIKFLAPYRRKGVPPATIAVWNRENRFGRAFTDRTGLAWVAMDVDTSRGVTEAALEANIARWIAVLNAFENLLGG